MVGKEQAQIEAIVLHRMARIVAALQIGSKRFNRSECLGHGLASPDVLAQFNLRHGVVILLPFIRVVELGIA